MMAVLRCNRCTWLMEPIMMTSTNGLNTEQSPFFMIVSDCSTMKAYSFYECTNAACGATEMFRDRSKDQPIIKNPIKSDAEIPEDFVEVKS